MTRHHKTQLRQTLPAVMTALAIAFGLTQLAVATGDERIAVGEIKPLMMLAADRGEAHGVLSGAGAAYTQRRFNTSAPIEIDVRRLRTLPKAGCGRLEVTTHQRAVMVSGKGQDQELVYQLSFCADGRFPEDR